jgi:iron complex transport system substrate-binding protein
LSPAGIAAATLALLAGVGPPPGAAQGEFDPWAGPPSVEPAYVGGRAPPSRPKRIVCLAPSATEIVFALGGGPRVVAVTRFDEDPPEVKALPKVGGFVDPAVEAVIGQRPELVLAVPNPGNRAALERIAELKVPVLLLPGASLADLAHAARAVAKALGGDAPLRAEQLLDGIRAGITELRAGDRAPPPRVLFVYGHDPLIVAGPGSFADTLLLALRATNVVTVKAAYPSYSMEQVMVDAPEIILDASTAHGEQARRYWSRWKGIPAIEHGRVYAVSGTDLLRPGPRILEGMRRLASLIAPPRR